MPQIDTTRPVRLANGWPAKVYERIEEQLLGAYRHPEEERWMASGWSLDGKTPFSGHGGQFDLVQIPQRHKRWAVISLRQAEGVYVCTGVARLFNEKPADPRLIPGIGAQAVACVQVEFEDGEGLPLLVTPIGEAA